MKFEIWYLIVGLIIVLNLVVSVFLARRDDLEIIQKVLQILIVWLIPVIAAIGLWLFNRDQDKPSTPRKSFGGGPQDSGSGGSVGGGD